MIEIESVPLCDVSFQSDKWLIHKKEIMHNMNEVMYTFREAFPLLKEKGHLDLILADDLFIQDLNSRYRGKDRPTNVLSFPQENLDKGTVNTEIPFLLLGDIVMAYETLQAEAQAKNISFIHHFCHLLLHGLLHLVGYDHETDEDQEEMEKLEIQLLEGLSIPNPYEAEFRS